VTDRYSTHTHTHRFGGHFPGTSGLFSRLPWFFFSMFSEPSRHVETVQNFLCPPCLRQMFHPSSFIDLRCHTSQLCELCVFLFSFSIMPLPCVHTIMLFYFYLHVTMSCCTFSGYYRTASWFVRSLLHHLCHSGVLHVRYRWWSQMYHNSSL